MIQAIVRQLVIVGALVVAATGAAEAQQIPLVVKSAGFTQTGIGVTITVPNGVYTAGIQDNASAGIQDNTFYVAYTATYSAEPAGVPVTEVFVAKIADQTVDVAGSTRNRKALTSSFAPTYVPRVANGVTITADIISPERAGIISPERTLGVPTTMFDAHFDGGVSVQPCVAIPVGLYNARAHLPLSLRFDVEYSSGGQVVTYSTKIPLSQVSFGDQGHVTSPAQIAVETSFILPSQPDGDAQPVVTVGIISPEYQGVITH